MKNKKSKNKNKNFNDKIASFIEMVRNINLANKLTILRILLVPIFVVMLSLYTNKVCLILALVIFIAASVTDYLDGYFARTRLMVTPLGQFLDPIADKILVTSALVLMANARWVWGWLIAIIVVRDLIVSAIRLVAVQSDSKTVIPARASGKVKTAVTMVSVGIIIFLWMLAGLGVIRHEVEFTVVGEVWNFPGLTLRPIGNTFMCICTALTVFSGVQYVWDARHILKKELGKTK